MKYFCKCSHSSLSDARCLVLRGFLITEALASLESFSSVCRSPVGSKNVYSRDEGALASLVWSREHLDAEISYGMGHLLYLGQQTLVSGLRHRFLTTCLFPGSLKVDLRLVAHIPPQG